jgi:hypothetical protein
MPSPWRTSDLTVLGIAAAGTIVLTAASFLVAPSESLPRQDGSSYAVHREGGRAALLLLRELGYRVDRSLEPLAALRYAPQATTLVIANPVLLPSQQDRRALQSFLDRGGNVLATGSTAYRFLPGVPGKEMRQARARRLTAALPSPLSAGVADIEMSPATVALPLDSSYVPIFGSYDEPAVLSARFGEGRAIWWASSGPLVNGGIGRPGHAELLINSVGPPGERTIVWDEFYHGHTRSLWSYLAGTPLPLALLQLAAVAALALFTFARRRQPARARVVEPRTSPLEFIDTMGGLYERAKATSAAVATVLARVRRRLLSGAGLTPSTADDRLVAVASERLTLDAGELARLLADADAATRNPNLTARQALAIVGDLQSLAGKIRVSGNRRNP